MNAKEAYTLLETLLDGVDPMTGELLPENHVCQEPAVLRALHMAVVALRESEDRSVEKSARVNRNGRLNAGRPWTALDHQTLWDMWAQGKSEREMARALQRTPYAIRCRMERLGMLDQEDSDEPPLLPPWPLEDVKRLIELHAQGRSVEEIAKVFHNPVKSIRARMFYMGLMKDEPD